MSTLRANNIENIAGGSPNIVLPAGSILQVVQVVKTDAAAIVPGAVWADIPGLSASITPRFSTSKILVNVDLKMAALADNSVVRSRLLRDGSPIYVGDAASSRPRSMSQFYISGGGAGLYYMSQGGGMFLDSPATTSSVTYKIQIGGDSNSMTLYVNRTQGDRDGAYMDARGVSSITLMEVAA